MKQNDIADLAKLDTTRLENIFNIYEDTTGTYYYNLLNTVHISDNLLPTSYTLHTPQKGESYTGISYKYYNTINLWWLICAASNINDPTKPPYTYPSIRVLNKDLVVALLTKINNR